MGDAQFEPGTDDRFIIRGKLGAGGMGVVYRAWDQVAQREVALKTLKATSARDLFRFKREFRALCDLAHPGLLGGAAGAALVATATAGLAAQAVTDVGRWTRMILPRP